MLGAVFVISSDSPFKEGHVRFTIVSYKILNDH